MTDNEVIKALEHCGAGSCVGCPLIAEDIHCIGKVTEKAIDLINRQQAEIDILIRKKESLRDEICELQTEVERLKEFEYMYNDLCK